MFRVTVSGPREQEASFFTVVAWRGQAEPVAESLSKGSRIVVIGRLQQRAWTAENGSARSVVEVVAEELGPSPRWAGDSISTGGLGPTNHAKLGYSDPCRSAATHAGIPELEGQA